MEWGGEGGGEKGKEGERVRECGRKGGREREGEVEEGFSRNTLAMSGFSNKVRFIDLAIVKQQRCTSGIYSVQAAFVRL